MDVVVLNEESNMPDREKLFLSEKKTLRHLYYMY
jgi:hypothetical protein